VDVQQDFFDRPGLSPPQDELIEQLQRLLTGWRARGRPVLHIRTRIAADGWRPHAPLATTGYSRLRVGTPGCEPPHGLEAGR
jgi:nicotinamidase-related amidase